MFTNYTAMIKSDCDLDFLYGAYKNIMRVYKFYKGFSPSTNVSTDKRICKQLEKTLKDLDVLIGTDYREEVMKKV